MRRTITLALVAATLMVSACSKPAADPAAPEAATPEATAAEVSGTSAAPTVAAAGATGVPECDDMYAKIEKCVADKIPAAQRAPLTDALNKSRQSIINMAAGNKATMAQSCKSAGEAMKAQYAALGCTL